MPIIDLINQYPKISIIIIAVGISFFTSLINYFFLDKERMREIKSKQKELRNKATEHRKAGNMEQMMQVNNEMMQHSFDMMKHSFRPMLITMIPILIIFSFIRKIYATTSIAGQWFWFYFIAAIISSIIFRKLLKLP